MNLQSFNQNDDPSVAQPGTGEQLPNEPNSETVLSESSSQNEQDLDDRKGTENADATSGPSEPSKPRKRAVRAQPLENGGQAARRRKRSGGRSLRSESTTPEGIITLTRRQRQNAEGAEKKMSAATESTLSELEAQGFTEDEAYNLIHVSDRIANSREAREAEAIIRRLRFNRWLFEQGKLSEFSA